jgi:cobalamin biosynthesis protein CobD/CbiB
MSAMAGALRVRLEKTGHYVLGDGQQPPSGSTIDSSLVIMAAACIFSVVLVTAIQVVLYAS